MGDDRRGVRNVSRVKAENEVNEPQKPVARPIYSGMVLLMAMCAFLCRFIFLLDQRL